MHASIFGRISIGKLFINSSMAFTTHIHIQFITLAIAHVNNKLCFPNKNRSYKKGIGWYTEHKNSAVTRPGTKEWKNMRKNRKHTKIIYYNIFGNKTLKKTNRA